MGVINRTSSYTSNYDQIPELLSLIREQWVNWGKLVTFDNFIIDFIGQCELSNTNMVDDVVIYHITFNYFMPKHQLRY
jgi:hypothetical protein